MEVLISALVALPVGFILGVLGRWVYARYQLSSAEQRAERIRQDAIRESENKKKEILLEAKDQLLRERTTQERDLRERRQEIQKLEKRLIQKEDNLDIKLEGVEKQQIAFVEREKRVEERESRLENQEALLTSELERISGLTTDEAKKVIIQKLEGEARYDAQILVNKIEQEAIAGAEKKARELLVSTVQRIASEVTSEMTVSTITLPNDEMKGRIIGKEGRNIRTLENLTGVDVIIDDTPEAVVISCFDPIRRAIAKASMERLIIDGRIHPARIEEVVQRVAKEINQTIQEEGEKVVFDLGMHGMAPDLVRALGRLHYRTSYGQNVLSHSKEVSIISGMIAAEIGLDVPIARRAALLHDIGKGMESEGDENHAELGAELARKCGEDPRVVNGIASHHNDLEPICPEAMLVQVADAVSAARPGARRESLDTYIKRLQNLEEIGESFEGVDKCFAIQAGREVRILVNTDKVNDQQARDLAKEIAKKIENDLRYPGRIKVTIIRETRVVEYAR